MRIIVYIFILSSLLFACQEDKIDFSEKFQEAKFIIGSSGGVATRAEGTNFDKNDKIGIYVVRHLPGNNPVLKSSGNYADNKCYIVKDHANLIPNSENDKIYASESGYVYSIFAYYPYDESITDPLNVCQGVQLDQSYKIANLKKSDFMLAQTLNADIDLPIYLNFKRKLARLNLIYNKTSGITPRNVALRGLKSRYKINLQTGLLQECENDNTVAPFYKYDESPTQCFYCMILPPYPFNLANGENLQVDLYERLDRYEINDLVLQGGVQNTIYLTGEKRHVTYSAVSDVGIGGTVSGSGEIYVTDGKECTVSANLYSGYAFAGWFANGTLMSKDLKYTFTVTQDIYLEARFYQAYKINLYTNLSGNSGMQYVTGGGLYRPGETCYLKAEIKPGIGYTFVGWFVNGKLMSRHWWYKFQPNKDLDVEARFATAYDWGWIIEEVTFPATPGTYYWEYTLSTVSAYHKDEEPYIYCTEVFFVEDSSYYEEPFYSQYGSFEMIKIEIKSLDLTRTLAVTNSTTGMLRFQNLTEPGFHIQRSIRYKYVSQRNRPVKGKMYMRRLGYPAHLLDVEPYFP